MLGNTKDLQVGDVWNQSVAEIFETWDSGDWARAGHWDETVGYKKDDEHYAELRDSIREKGFVRPLTCRRNQRTGKLMFLDGHHRLFIAEELGMLTVPIQLVADGGISHDSGSWRKGATIPLTNPLYED